MRIRRSIGDKFGTAKSLVNLGFIKKQFGEFKQAEHDLKASIAIGDEIGAKEIKVESLKILSEFTPLKRITKRHIRRAFNTNNF